MEGAAGWGRVGGAEWGGGGGGYTRSNIHRPMKSLANAIWHI